MVTTTSVTAGVLGDPGCVCQGTPPPAFGSALKSLTLPLMGSVFSVEGDGDPSRPDVPAEGQVAGVL